MADSTREQFLRFAVVGAAGFAVDSAALYIAMQWLHSGHYLGRLISYLIAATFTWAMNRRFTFAGQVTRRRLSQWLKFLAVNSTGGAANYAVYALLVGTSMLVTEWPVIGVAAGSVAGLAINFILSRKLVFEQRSSGS
jgi:putative flippase GtrA